MVNKDNNSKHGQQNHSTKNNKRITYKIMILQPVFKMFSCEGELSPILFQYLWFLYKPLFFIKAGDFLKVLFDCLENRDEVFKRPVSKSLL